MDKQDSVLETQIVKKTEFQVFRDYLSNVITTIMDINGDIIRLAFSKENNEKALARFLVHSQEMILIISHREGQTPEQTEIDANLSINQMRTDSGEAIAFFKKQNIELERVKNQKNYLKQLLNVLIIGEMGEDFDIIQVFNETLSQGVLPLLQNYKLQLQIGEQMGEENITQWNKNQDSYQKFNNLYKKFNELQGTIQQKLNTAKVVEIEFEFNDKILEICKNVTQPSISDVPEQLLSNSDFIENLSEKKLKWVSQCNILMTQGRENKISSIMDEVSFWGNFVKSLDDLEKQLERPEVRLTQEILKFAKKPNEIINKEDFQNLKKQAQTIEKIMNELKFNQILISLKKDENSVDMKEFLTHLKKLTDKHFYPLQRLKNFMIQTNKEFIQIVCNLLRERNLFSLSNAVFNKLIDQIKTFPLQSWGFILDQLKEGFRVARQNDIVSNNQIITSNQELNERVQLLHEIKNYHDELVSLYEQTFTSNTYIQMNLYKFNFPTIKDLEKEFELFNRIDIMDISVEGKEQLISTYNTYLKRTTELDKQIVQKIHEIFSQSLSNNEKMQIFSNFSQLQKRPFIKQELQEYQDNLIAIIKNDIEKVIEKFKKESTQTKNSLIVRKYRISSFINVIIWNEQILNVLNDNILKLKTNLGANWMNTLQGKEIFNMCEKFSIEIDKNIKEIIKYCENKYNNKKNEKLFTVRKRDKDDKLELHPNINGQTKEIIKAMKLLFQWYVDVNKKYLLKFMFRKTAWPSYMSMYVLQNSVNIFNGIIDKITPQFKKLLSNQLKIVYTKLEQAQDYCWFTENESAQDSIVEHFSLTFSHSVQILAENTKFLETKSKIIDNKLLKLKEIDNYDAQQDCITDIQNIVNEFEDKKFQNQNAFVDDLNQQIKAILKEKLDTKVLRWSFEFLNLENLNNDNFVIEDQKIIFQPTIHNLGVQNQQIILNPPLEYTKKYWLSHLQNLISNICSLKKIKKKDQYFKDDDIRNKNFQDLIEELNLENLEKSYNILNECIERAEEYIQGWQHYQALWELDVNKVYEFLGENTTYWEDILDEIKQGRNIFDQTESAARFGPILVQVRLAQRKINNKYESLHTEILNKFGKNLSQEFIEFHNEIAQKRFDIENIDFNDSEKITEGIQELRKCREKFDLWENKVERFKSGEKLLYVQKYQFPITWKDFYIVESEWERFQQSYELKQDKFKQEYQSLKSRLDKEEKQLMMKVKSIEQTWQSKKPYSGDLHPDEALSVINNLEKQINDNQQDFHKLNEAKELLDLPQIDLTTINSIQEDSKSLKELWSYIQQSWSKIDKIMETPMKIAHPSKFQSTYDEILEEMNGLPNKFRTYEVLVMKKNQISEYKKFNRLLKDVKTDALKEHHWNDLCKKIKLPKKFKNLSVGDFYKHNPFKYSKIIDEIIQSAQGELVLENMIKKIRDFWNFEEFDLGKYQEKCMLIRGWDDLMTKIEDDLALISSMKLSQHFKTFEEEIKGWNDKLVMLQNILDIWVNVQKKWVYLEGIFLGSSDISQQLPNEYSRFRGIDNDFTSLMKKTAARKKILDTCLNIPNLEKSLKLLYENLEKIQKALSDYLEKQRQAFARFYFVGDEDLLEIIGNSKDITNIQKYFSKMFAGINFIENEDNGVLLTGMRSRENETVHFSKAFKISDYGKINLWLDELEYQMKKSLAIKFEQGIDSWTKQEEKNILSLLEQFCAQDILISFQTYWTYLIEEGNYDFVLKKLMGILDYMAEAVLTDLPKLTRSKFEQLITEFVHKRDTTRHIQIQGLTSEESFFWFSQMKYFNYENEIEITKKLTVHLGNSQFMYGYEYLGVTEKLVQTPLTDKCYFTLTQALWLRMGGAPFGPAGTGKTESVKMLGSTLGRFVLVFNCDETFNFKAMGRIFIGLCQVGAWGCFDEFNRLEERILSAVSQQILTIQMGLREKLDKIDLMGRDVKLNVNMGIFVTMNPGYAGRSNLPENLKQLFRQMAMIKPDGELIAQVMLFSQGFKSAEQLSGKVVSLFELCADQLSQQPHYDFGLRALKSVLNSAGSLKRRAIQKNAELANQPIEEQKIILRSFCDTVVPKLISDDAPLLESLIKGVFPNADIPKIEDLNLRKILGEECEKRNLLETPSFVEKILQLNQILKLQHGIMLVGPTGCGKSAAWESLLSALYHLDGTKGESYIIDPKAITKEELFGKLDDTTLEWTDGIFTFVLRKINENARGESQKRHWIIFDGDVDPEWVENLNSVLDDNKIFTLPNGERIGIPQNVKIIFEVESLKYATLATVSRCGMVWFSEDVLKPQEIFYHYLTRLKMEKFDSKINNEKDNYNKTREFCVSAIEPLFYGKFLDQVHRNHQISIEEQKSLVLQTLKMAKDQEHVMEFSYIRVLEALFTLIRKGIERIVEYNQHYSEFPLSEDIQINFIKKWTLISMIWSFVGDIQLSKRALFYDSLLKHQSHNLQKIDLPILGDKMTLIDFTVDLKTGQWVQWLKIVPDSEVDQKDINNANTIITTVDTLRHQEILCSWLLEKRPFIICGPPGSGKTMTLMSTLRNLPDYEMIFVNFSASTTPSLILKQFEHYCEYVKSTKGIVLRPKSLNKNLVVFCDEINLPDQDDYGTQSVVTFLRQLTEQKGFWQNSNHSWIKLERIQFVGACNPPTDAGRHPLGQRFLRHSPLMLVDFPGYQSLMQIYGSFNKAMLKPHPELRNRADELTKAMVDYYTESQIRFTADQHPHYIYSPRELTRWKYALYEGLSSVNSMEELVRLWAHEALRLFEDRLVTDEEKVWCQDAIDRIAKQNFKGVNFNRALERPILFSTYLNKTYMSVDQQDLRQYIIEKLREFNEEEYQIQLVVFDSVLDHMLRIDRVLRQPIGHLLLVGASGVGKTTLSRFVSWMNGLNVFQIKAGRNYGLADFDANLRDVMKRSGCKGEKITFIFDESNVLGVAFLERMNALLASGEVPGLFEGEEYLALINQYKENQGGNRKIESDEEIYQNFTRNVQRNLHVVFTMNPANPDFSNRAASSPAIFNRCVIDWFGDWSDTALHQVARELTENMSIPENSIQDLSLDISDVIEKLIVKIHTSVCNLNDQLKKGAKKFNYMTPRDFLDFINHFIYLHKEKKEILEEQQVHLNKGLTQLKNTEIQVQELDDSLKNFKIELDASAKESRKKMTEIEEESLKAEEKQKQLQIIGEELDKKNKEIEQRKEIVEKDLKDVKPKLLAAQQALKSMDNRAMSRIKTLKNPPTIIKFALEGVLLLVTGKVLEWKDIVKHMVSQGFIQQVLELDMDKVKKSVIKKLQENYINNPQWDDQKISHAFETAGILAKWVESQIVYGTILTNIEPLTNEIKELEVGQSEAQEQQNINKQALDEIKKKLEIYKQEFKILTQKTNKIKGDMEKVNVKVAKSKKLLENLSSEKRRWTIGSEGFADQLSQMTGDVMISAAFLTYCGFFDQLYRNILVNYWQKSMEESKLKFKFDLSISEFLSSASERMFWQSHKLPNDEICSQNAIILKRFNRYPLVIDPSGQAYDFLMSYYKDKKIEKTDFQDPNFIKILEKCLRFGLPVLIQNVERVDPMMNSILNKETIKMSGRIIVRVGDQEIDYNKNFKMFMLTKNQDAKFTPDLCSRVTFVNFTVTQSSLENQCINLYLKNERPDIEEKRLELLKLQGEFLLKLRTLEDDLLTKISDQTGNILENEPLLKTLDTLKIQADEITHKMEESEQVLEQVEQVTQEYQQISYFSAKIYFTLQKLADINSLYQYSFQFYMKIILNLLKRDERLNAIAKTQYKERIQTIENQLFISVYHIVENSLLTNDKLLLAIKFTQMRLGNKYGEDFKAMLESPAIIESNWYNVLENVVNKRQLVLLENLSKKPHFHNLKKSLQSDESEWKRFIQNRDYMEIPKGWFEQEDKISNALMKLLLTNILKPTRSYDLIRDLVNSVMDEEFLDTKILNTKELILNQASAKNPIFFNSAPGFDPSGKILQVAKEINKTYTAIALGSSEGFIQAEKALDRSVKTGSWVILKNVHLAITWVKEIEQFINKANPHTDFRVFFISEFNDKLPLTLLRISAKAIFELPEGIKSNVYRTLQSTFQEDIFNREPKERGHIYFQMTWLHAVIMERLRYTPIGWSKKYEFSEADLKSSIEIIDQFLEKEPNKIKKILSSLRIIITNNVYGGKIDNNFDLKILQSLVEEYLDDQFFINSQNHYFVKDVDQVIVQSCPLTDYQGYLNWVKKIPDSESPIWAGLPYAAEEVLKQQNLNLLLSKMHSIQDINEEEIEGIKEEQEKDEQTQLKWLTELKQKCQAYLNILPKEIPQLERNQSLIENPLFRFLEREVTVCSKLLSTVRSNLFDLVEMVNGTLQPLQYLKQLAQIIYQSDIPKDWIKYVIQPDIDISIWIQDFKKRLDQIIRFCKVSDWQRKGVNVGLMLYPEAFLTASRQFVAQKKKISLDSLELRLYLTRDEQVAEDSFLVKHMTIQGVNWDFEGIHTDKKIAFSLSDVQFKWEECGENEQKNLKEGEILVPIYLNSSRQNLLTAVKFNIKNSGLKEQLLYQRGIGFIVWNI